jgi:hypothetical protein
MAWFISKQGEETPQRRAVLRRKIEGYRHAGADCAVVDRHFRNAAEEVMLQGLHWTTTSSATRAGEGQLPERILKKRHGAGTADDRGHARSAMAHRRARGDRENVPPRLDAGLLPAALAEVLLAECRALQAL